MSYRRRNKKKSSSVMIVLALTILFTGFFLILYPIVSSFLAKRQQENVIIGYENTLHQIDKESLRKEWEKAVSYDGDPDKYENILNLEGNGVMGYIEIPKIGAKIPIYHYTTEESIQKGVGHMEQTGFPIGGKGNHPVLTGHRGLPNAELFTRLDELEKGDLFFIYVLDKVLAYKVSEIQIVLPEKVNHIKEENSKDQITLVTCTPYGVNTHRLLVTGERTKYVKYEEKCNTLQEVDNTSRNKIIFYIIIIFTGMAVVMYPLLSHKRFEAKINRQKVIFIMNRKDTHDKKEELYQELDMRNLELYLNGQSRLTNEAAYQKTAINLKKYGLKDNILAYISIPKMNIELPILLGANEANMKKGAVHLTETSYPIGGENTNCVVAAHRGYSKTAMFRNIEKLRKGDKIYVENFMEKLVYQVMEYKVIMPEDIDQILIQEGKELLTLMTCHPYKKNSHRYIVFCERI